MVGFAGRQVDDAHFPPGNAHANTAAERLGAGFLGSESAWRRRRHVPARLFRLGPLDFRKDPVCEPVAEPVQRLFDPADVDQVAADALRSWMVLSCFFEVLRVWLDPSAAARVKRCRLLPSVRAGRRKELMRPFRASFMLAAALIDFNALVDNRHKRSSRQRSGRAARRRRTSA